MDSISLGRNWCWIGPYRHPITARSRVAGPLSLLANQILMLAYWLPTLFE